MNWNQPICEPCWNIREPHRTAVRTGPAHARDERCAFCGQATRWGAYVRAHPSSVPFPAPDRTDEPA